MFKEVIKRFPEIFIDDSGKVSMSKILMFLLVILIFEMVNVYLYFAWLEIQATHKLPAWPATLAGTITAISGVIAGLYAANKFSPTFDFLKKDGDPK